MSTSKDRKIRVLADYGIVTKKILWIDRTKKHICYGNNIKNFNWHFTYHSTGYQHFKEESSGDTYQFGNKIPLDGFEGKCQPAHTSIPLSELEKYDDYTSSVIDESTTISIDMQELGFEKDSINIDIQFVDENREDLITHVNEAKVTKLFKQWNPWIVISIW